MPEVNGNYEQQYQMNGYDLQQTGAQNQRSGYRQAPIRQKTLRDEFVTQHKKNGLIERLYNGIKNLTGLGMGSKKVKAIVAKAENGEISEDKAREAISKYRSSQANSAQVAGDAVSMGTALFGYMKLQDMLTKESGSAFLRKIFGIVKKEEKKNIQDSFKIDWQKLKIGEADKVKFFKNPGKVSWKLALGTLFTAGMSKVIFSIVNRIGSQEFNTNKKDFNGAKDPYDKAAYSQARKFDRKERHKAGWRNFFSGAINGITMPLIGLVGGIVGVPLYFLTNTLNRYFVGNHADGDKSFKGYFGSLKNDWALNSTLALSFGIPAFLKTHNLHVFDKAQREGVKYLQRAKFKAPDYYNTKTNYEEISEIMMRNKDIKAILDKENEILNKGKMSRSIFETDIKSFDQEAELQKLATELNDKNFFAAKFKQISNDGTALARILKEDCPPTRNYEQAQAYVDKVFGKGKYILDKDHYCLGVGTVAETYFATNNEGKEVCIKAIKEKMSAEKIETDRKAFKKFIDNLTTKPDGTAYTKAEKEMFKRNVDDLAEGVLKEIDLSNEMKAAQDLARDTQFANVVKGIEVKDNVYVMERANGISLESLMNLNEAYAALDTLQGQGKGNSLLGRVNAAIGEEIATANMSRGSQVRAIMRDNRLNDQQKMKKLREFIDKIESKTPTHGNVKLQPEDIKGLIKEYQQVLVEQFNKISESGKVIHGDIHPGNIFIDIDALQSMEKSNKFNEFINEAFGRVRRKNHGVFTLIDTGNVIRLDEKQSIGLLNLTSYIDHGNYRKIAEYVMQGVEGDALGGHTKEEATKLIANELKKCFTDNTTPLDIMTNDNMIKLTSGIMKKYNIVPNDTQLNLNKAIQSANNSYDSLVKGLFDGRLGNGEALGQLFGFGEGAKDGTFLRQIKKNMERAQEKENLRKMSAAGKRNLKNIEGNFQPNQKEYHIYKLKQGLYQPEVIEKTKKKKDLSEQTADWIESGMDDALEILSQL